ncbi:MAG: tetratricopeptide repeat protein [Thermoplasmatota archaeon]
MPSCTVKEKILLHLRGFEDYIEKTSVPKKITQAGIAETLNVSKGHISKVIYRVKNSDEGLLIERVKHIDGLKRMRKIYFLTSKGIEKSKDIRNRLIDEEITVSTDEGLQNLKIKDVLKRFDYELIDVLLQLEEGILDIKDSKRNEDHFVGREKELRRLKELLDSVFNNNSINVIISGKAGIGKTRLVREFKRCAGENDVKFLEGKSYVNSSDPYLPLKEALEEEFNENIFEKIEDEDLIIDRKKMKAKKNLSFKNTADLIAEHSDEQPLVIFLDDLHWADKATIDILYYLMNRIQEKRVMFIGTYRTEDISAGDPLKEMLQKASREKVIERIDLKELEEKDCDEIVKNILKTDNIPAEFLDLLNEKALGNPLFIKESVFQMLEEGIIDIKNDVFPISDEDVKIPRIIDDIINRRIDRLDRQTKYILEVGSVIGKDVRYDVLTDVINMDEMNLIDNIENLIDFDIWTEEKNGKILSFTHVLISDTVYQGMSRLKRKNLHKKIADSYEQILKDDIEEHYTNLASHYKKAEDHSKAVDYFVKAGRYARELFAHENAREQYENAVELIGKVENYTNKFEVYYEYAEVLRILGVYEKSKDIFKEAMKYTDEKIKQQKTYRNIGNLFASQSRYEIALSYFKQGLSLSDENNLEKCKLLHSKGWTLMMLNEYDKAEKIFQEEKEIAQNIGSKKYTAKGIHDIGIHAYHLGKYEEAIDILQDALKIIEGEDEKKILSGLYNDIGIIYRRSGYLDEALKYLEKSLSIRMDMGYQYDIATSLTNLGLLHIDKGRLDKALEKEKESLEIWKRIDNKDGIASAYNNIGIVYEFMGDSKKALENHEKSLGIWRNLKNKYRIGEVLANLGNSYRKLDNFELSEKYIKESLRMKEEIDDKNGIGTSLEGLGNLYKDMGKIDKAINNHERSLKIAEENGLKRLGIRSHMDLSKDYLELENIKESCNYINKTMGELGKMNIPVLEPEAKMIYGKCLVAKGEFEKGKKMLHESVELSKDMDMQDKFGKSSYYLGEILKEKGERKKAEKHIEKSYEVFKQNNRDLWVKKCEKILK